LGEPECRDGKPSPTKRDASARQASSITEATATPTRSFRNDGSLAIASIGPHKAQEPRWRRGCRHPPSGDLHAILMFRRQRDYSRHTRYENGGAGRRAPTMRPGKLGCIRPTVASTEPLRLSTAAIGVKRRLECFARKSRPAGHKLGVSAVEFGGDFARHTSHRRDKSIPRLVDRRDLSRSARPKGAAALTRTRVPCLPPWWAPRPSDVAKPHDDQARRKVRR
jgi:hypothetical protein